MFMPCSDAPLLADSSIVAFCAALNTPVVNIDVLEVGPARAGIMIAAGESNELNLLVRVCLISSGVGVTFKFQGDPAEFRDPAAAMDAALSFSEGMGFLFEDDLLSGGGPAGRQRASKIWKSLCGQRDEAKPDSTPAKPSASPAPIPESRPAPEIELTDPLAQVSAQVLAEVPSDLASSEVGAAILTKFRRGAIADTDETVAFAPEAAARQEVNDSQRKPGSKELGRMDLASEQLGREDPRVSGFLTQLLSSFWVSN